MFFIAVAIVVALLWWMTAQRNRGRVRRSARIETRPAPKGDPMPRRALQDPALARVAAIDDPVALASIVIVAVATDDAGLQAEQEAALDEALSSIAPPEQVGEAAAQGRLTADQIRDPFILMDIAGARLQSLLLEDEKRHLVEMVRLVATDGGKPPARLDVMVRHLQRSLGLQVRQL